MLYKSNLLASASGSIGGTVFSRNRGGAYTRSRSIPVNPNTVQQQAVRSELRELAAVWSQTLTDIGRSAWKVFAANVLLPNALGDPRDVGGMAWYIKANVARGQAALPRVDVAPSVYGLAVFTNPTITITAATDIAAITFTAADEWATEVGGAMLVYTSPPQNPGVYSYSGPYRYAGKILGAASPPTSPASVLLAFPVIAGQKVFVRLSVVRSDGRVSDSFRTGGLAI